MAGPPPHLSSGGTRRLRLAVVWIIAVLLMAVMVLGPHLPFAVSLAVHTGAYMAFGWLFAVERRAPSLGARDLAPVIALLVVTAVVVAPIQSSDVWSYAIYGRMVAVHHVSPYLHVPADFPGDPYLSHVAGVWRHSPSVYGPLFAAFSAVVMEVAGHSALAARLLFQLTAAGALVAALRLVHARTGSVLGLIALGLNPLVIVGVVNAAHNDAVVGLLLLVGVLAVTGDHPVLASIALAAAVLIKLTAGFPLAAVVVWVWFRKGGRQAAVVVCTAGALSLLGLAVAGGTAILQPLQSAQLHISGGSLWRWPTHYLIVEGIKQGRRGRVAGPMVRAEVARWAAISVVGLTTLVAFSRRHDRSPAIAAGAGALIYVLAGPYVQPWYLAWALPCLALAYRSRFLLLGLAVGAVLHLVYVPDTQRSHLIEGSHPGHLDVAQWTARVYLVPIVLVVAVVAIIVLAGQRLIARQGEDADGGDADDATGVPRKQPIV